MNIVLILLLLPCSPYCVHSDNCALTACGSHSFAKSVFAWPTILRGTTKSPASTRRGLGTYSWIYPSNRAKRGRLEYYSCVVVVKKVSSMRPLKECEYEKIMFVDDVYTAVEMAALGENCCLELRFKK